MAGAGNCVRAEIEIDAPIDRVWQVLTDFDRYGEWNSFTPRVETTLRIGDPIHLHVRLGGKGLTHRVEHVTRNRPYTLGWEMKMGARTLLYAERVQTLRAVDEGRTHYVTEDCFRGWLRPLVFALYGGALERGFADCAEGLKKAAESGQARGRNESMSDDGPRERIHTGKSWDEFCDTLKAAGKTILADGAPDDPLNRSEGFRYLARLTRAGLESFLEYADPAAPELHRPIHETAKIGADNPDNHYQNAQISGAYEYRIVGKRNTIHYLDFATQTPGVASTGDSRQSGHLDAADLEIGEDGTFEILLSCEEKPGNWLRMVPETTQLIVRQTYLDRSSETPADLRIERIGGAQRPAPLTPELVDKGLASAAGLVVGCSNLFSGWAKGFQTHTNQLPRFDDSVSMGAGGDPNICYYHSYWELVPEEALLIEVTPPECRSWNFQLDNHWMESLDYRYFRVTINKHTARYEPDGSLRIIVAHADPGHPNWIETAGHRQGTMCFRWIRADEHPEPRCRVVKVSELG